MIADRHKRNRGRALFHLASMTGAEYDRLATINPRRWTDEELSLLQRRLNEAGLGLVSDALGSVRMDKTDAAGRDREITINQAQAKAILEALGSDVDEDATVTIVHVKGAAHNGPGLYIYDPEYPEHGSTFLGAEAG